jgi:RHS repeat-associated protein
LSVIRDATPPTLTLAAVVQGTDVHVIWSATDPSPGSGVDASTCLLEVREDEGAWQTFSTECGGDDTHDGEPGHSYTFRLSAGDNVGNADSLEVQAVVPYVTKYYYANGQRVAMWQGDVVYYIHADHLGSTSVLSDESGQPAGERVAYLPYGGVRLGDASTLPTDYGFTGQRLEAGLGLMHYGARFYSPRLGRFVSADTIIPNPLNPQDFNRYTYGRNNPLAYIDADGHFPVLVLVALGVTAAGIAFFRTPACAGEGCAPGTSGNSLEYQVRSYATAAETAVEVYFGAELLFGELLAEAWQGEDRGQNPGQMTNEEIRQWYNDEVSRIPELNKGWIEEGWSAEERSQAAYEIRHDARMKAREMMTNPDEVEMLRARDLEKYGNPDGPTFESLVDYYSEKGYEGDALYEKIIERSYETSPEYNRRYGIH